MPRRSTPFQKLIHHIQQQLANGASVTESEMLKNPVTGEECEVDIVIRATVGAEPIVVAVECVEKARKAGRPWIEEMRGKHELLETDKLVLVSLNGFTKSAVKLAKFRRIKTYTPERANDAEWSDVIRATHQTFSKYTLMPQEYWLTLAPEEGREDHESREFAEIPSDAFQVADTTLVRNEEFNIQGPLAGYVASMLTDSDLGFHALQRLEKDGKGRLLFRHKPGNPILAQDPRGQWHLVARVYLKFRFERESSLLRMRSLGVGGTPAAFGSDQTVFGKILMTIVETNPGEPHARVIIEGKEVATRRVKPLPK